MGKKESIVNTHYETCKRENVTEKNSSNLGHIDANNFALWTDFLSRKQDIQPATATKVDDRLALLILVR
jgi:hypothetical protein